MKNLFKKLLILSISLIIFSCSKKVTTFNFGKPYHNQEEQVKESVTPGEDEIVTASASESPVVIQKQEIIKTKPETVIVSKKDIVKAEKPTIMQRIAAKKLQKKLSKVENKAEVNDKMKLGIVIAAVSLVVLIVVAAGLLGGLGSLFWLLGGLGLLTGLIIILLAALDVI